MKNNVRDISVIVYEDSTSIYIYRRNSSRRVTERHVGKVLDVLSNGTYTPAITHEHGAIITINFKPMELSERGYRDVLRYAYQWIHSNVDGWMEGMPRADFFWHLLGAIVAAPGDVWTRDDHKEHLYREVSMPKVWQDLFRSKG